MININTIKTDNFTMEYFKFGTGKRNFVILPGLSVQSVMGSADAISGAFNIGQDDFTFYVIDRKKELPQEYSIYDMARDTAEAVKALGLKDNYFFGASQGGMVAMTIAIEYPELVKKLAIASTSSHVTDEQYENLDKWIELARKGEKEKLYLCFGEMIYPPAVFEQFREYFIETSKTVTDDDLKRFIILASGTKDFNVTDRLSEIHCPVLTTGTFEDRVLDSDATLEIAENLDYRPDFQLYLYNGFGHASFDTAPDFKKRVYDFFMEGE